MAWTTPDRIIGSLWSSLLGMSIGLAGILLTVLSLSIQSRWVALDAEAALYGFPLPWMSKNLGFTFSFMDFLNQARAPPTINYPAFALDFLVYTSPLLALAYLLIGAASRYSGRRVPMVFSSSGALLCIAGVLSVLLGMTFVLTSLSSRVTTVYIDAEANWYGSPLPWLYKAFGKPAITVEGLLQQIRAPPVVDYRALLVDLGFYTLPVLVMVNGTLVLIRISQYLAKKVSQPKDSLIPVSNLEAA